MPLFVQTDHHVVDVSKITFINVLKNHVDLHFSGVDKPLRLGNDEAEALMNGIRELDHKHKLAAVRA